MSGELALNLLQEIHLLKKKCACKVEIDFVGRERDKNDLLSKIKDDPGRIRDFSARWKASVPGIEPLEFTSVPGCFCHRRLDEGGLALAEVASRELKESNGEKRLLDMGCGCGLVGYLIAKAAKDISLVMVDSHSRAVEAANINSANLKIPAEVILSDTGTPERMDGTFDVFVGNPPYYSDYRIADVFLETAKRALKIGGVCYTVCKNAAGLVPVQERYFPSVEIINRRGYAVLKSVKGL
jgi:16S rRNA (guanine1207-N2)-methyltransferase